MDLDDLELEQWCDVFPLEIHSDDSDIEETDASSHQNAPYYRITVELNDDSTTTVYSFNIPKHELLREETASSRNPVLDKLTEIGVPQNSQNVMKEKILACARDMARWTHVTHKVLPMFVTISLTGMAIHEEDSDNDEDGMVNVEDDEGHYGRGRVPASEASIERLERVVFGQGENDDGLKLSGVGGCSICLEDCKVGLQVTRMPCLHRYHENCIVDWLKQTNSCPLCRFLMPSATTV